MSKYIIQGETLTGIADAIRAKTGSTEAIAVGDMAAEIEAIESGGSGGGSGDKITLAFPEDSTFFDGTRSEAFKGWSHIENVIFPKNSEIQIDSYMFQDCTALNLEKLPDNITHIIKKYAFAGCTSLKINTLPKAVTTFNAYVFKGCTGLTDFFFPEGFKDTYGNTFRGCTNLKKVDYPTSLTNLSICEWLDCTSLTTLVIRASNMVAAGNDALSAMLKNTPIANGEGYIYVPASLVEAYKSAENWSSVASSFRALEDYTVDGTVTGELDESKI